MKIKRITNIKHRISIILLLFFVIILSSCNKDDGSTNNGKVSIIRSDSYITENGVLYNDTKNLSYKCYYDFRRKLNVYFCSRQNCDHSSIDCMSKQNHSYNFLVGNNQYYIQTQKEINKSPEQKIVSYLYKSNVRNTKTKAVAKLDGNVISEMYLVDHQLYTLVSKPIYSNGIVSSTRFDLYQINMKNFSINNVFLHKGNHNDYIPFGIINNKMILYHKYYDKAVKPADYGYKGNMKEFMNDTENYKKYMDAVMKVFHEEMIYVDLDTRKITQLDLPTPLLIHNECYFYNKKTPANTYQLIAHNFITNKENIIYDGPVQSLSVVGDTLFLKVENSTNSSVPSTISNRINNGKEYSYNLNTGEQKEVINHLSDKSEMNLIAEYGDYYIFLYRNLYEGIYQRIGYIQKKDYYNGKDNYTLATPI